MPQIGSICVSGKALLPDIAIGSISNYLGYDQQLKVNLTISCF